VWNIIKYFLLAIVLLVVGLAISINFSVIPDTKVVTGSELPNSVKEEMVENGIITEKEKIQYFYSEDLFSFIDYGNLFTQYRVVSYELDGETNERSIYSATYPEISQIEFKEGATQLDDSLIDVYVDGRHSFSLVVSREEDGDKVFYDALVEKWESIVK
jgi:hypothetical protein